jgi:hypothetical protein
MVRDMHFFRLMGVILNKLVEVFNSATLILQKVTFKNVEDLIDCVLSKLKQKAICVLSKLKQKAICLLSKLKQKAICTLLKLKVMVLCKVEELVSCALLNKSEVVMQGRGWTRFNFFSVLVLFSIFNIIVNPWVYSGEMWAEMATNYFKISQEGDWFASLLAPDHGYIPLSQRLIAQVISLFGFPSNVVAYLYTWSAILCSSALVGVFCLRDFRPIVESDLARLLVSLVVLVILDWETTTFINFSYLNVFYISLFVMLSFYKKNDSASPLIYLIPLLIVSKAYVLSVVPLMILAVIYARTEYRKVFKFSLLLALLHIIYILNSYLSVAEFTNGEGFTVASKFISSFVFMALYTLRDLLGSEVFQLISNYSEVVSISLGFSVLVAVVGFICFNKKNPSPLILMGLAISFVTYFFNSFVNSPSFTITGISVSDSVYRHVVGGFIGSFFILIGVLQSCIYRIKFKFIRSFLMVFGVSVWFYTSGWFDVAIQNSKPGLLVSKWQGQSSYYMENADAYKPCVPIDPYPWVYNYGPAKIEDKVHCDYLAKMNFGVGRYLHFGPDNVIDIPVPVGSISGGVKSFMASVRSFDNSKYVMTMQVNILMNSGRTFNYFGQQEVSSKDSMLFINSKDNYFAPIDEIEKITLKFELPAIVWTLNGKPEFSWMGVAR